MKRDAAAPAWRQPGLGAALVSRAIRPSAKSVGRLALWDRRRSLLLWLFFGLVYDPSSGAAMSAIKNNPSAPVSPYERAATGKEVVVLLHGWWATPWALLRLQWSLESAGYRVVNLGYPSVRVSVEEVATNQLPLRLARRVPASATRIHFVTHSMGGLLLREYLRNASPPQLGRIVLIGPPNHGSELADGPHPGLLRWFAGPNARRLETAPEALPQRLPPATAIPTEVGVIAGDRPWWRSRKIHGPNDGRVSVASTKLEGMKDHVVVRETHTLLPWNSEVLRLVRQFLAAGSFEGADSKPVLNSSRTTR